MRNNIEKGIYLIVIVIVVGVLASGTTYVLMRQKNEVNNQQNDNKPNDGGNSPNKITFSTKELEDYLSYVPVDEAYVQDKVDVNTIDKLALLSHVVSKIENEKIYYDFDANETLYSNIELMCQEPTMCPEEELPTKNYIPISFINGITLKHYNYEFKNMKNTTKLDETLPLTGLAYYYQDGNLFSLWGGDEIYHHISVMDSYEATEEELIITEYAVRLGGATLYDYRLKKEIYLFNDDEEVDWSRVSDMALEYLTKNKKEFTKYEHTFKNEGNGYYWYQTKVK